MKVGIMQPYFLPYIGYWQLLNAVDKYVIYDNIEFTKNSWIRRNRILQGEKDYLFSLPLKKDSDYLQIVERELASDIEKEKRKILNKIKINYKNAPYFESIYPILEDIFNYYDKNLFNFIFYSIKRIKDYLEIKTDIIISSTLDIDHNLKGQKKVISICKKLEASEYYNAIGGQELYSYEEFNKEEIKLKFLKSGNIEYRQFKNEFIPNLSIIDVMMFNSKEKIKEFLNNYTLIGENNEI